MISQVVNKSQQTAEPMCLEPARLENAKKIAHFLIEAVDAGRVNEDQAKQCLHAAHLINQDLTGALDSFKHMDDATVVRYASILNALHKSEPRKYSSWFEHYNHLLEFNRLILRLGIWLKDVMTTYPLTVEQHVRVKNFLICLLREEEGKTPAY